MRVIPSLTRAIKCIENTISELSLNLSGMSVLTEVGSGPYMLTPLIAAIGGADRVYSIGKDSRFGTADELYKTLREYTESIGVDDKVFFSSKVTKEFAENSNIVTNLGFVRPINDSFLKFLPKDSMVSLMWEPWEFRENDIDLNACKKRHIPVVATNERDPRLNIFKYVGLTVLKLLFESEIEVFKSKVLIVGSGEFLKETAEVLKDNRSNVHVLIVDEKYHENSKTVMTKVNSFDAVVLVEHHSKQLLIGDYGLSVDWINSAESQLIHLCGNVDYRQCNDLKLSRQPAIEVSPGYMTVATDYVGARPVIDLHAAGLKVGQEVIEALRKNTSRKKTREDYIRSPLVLELPGYIYK